MPSIFIFYRSLGYLFNEKFSEKWSTSKRLNRSDRDCLHQIRLSVLQQYYSDIEITTNSFGKPVATHPPELVFNQSHSQQHYALAFSKDMPNIGIGIDIEDFSRSVRMQHMAEVIFHPQEYKVWQQLHYCQEYWFKVWTIKEAILKAHGIGLSIDLTTLNTDAQLNWDFGIVKHPDLGCYVYQNIKTAQSMMSIAFQLQQPMQFPQLVFI